MGFFGLFVATVAVIGCLYVLWKPHWAVTLIVVMWPLEQLIQSAIPVLRGTYGWVTNIVIGIIAIFTVILALMRRRPIFRTYVNPSSLMFFGLYALTVIGIGFSAVPELATEKVVSAVPYWVLLGGVLPLLLTDVRDLDRFLSGFLVVGSIVAILILVNPNAVWAGGRMRLEMGMTVIGAMYSNPLALGTLGGVLAVTAVLIRPRGATLLGNAMRVIAFVAGMSLAISSGSRGQVFAAIATFVIFLPLARKMRDPRQFLLTCASFAVFAIILLVVFKMTIGEQNRARWSSWAMESAAEGRFERVNELLGAWIDSPAHWLFGLGTGGWAGVTTFMKGDGYVHNLPVEALGEFGIVGFIFLCGILWLGAVNGRRLWKAYEDDARYRSLITVLLAICFFGFLLSLKQGSIVGNPAPLYWFVIVSKVYLFERSEEFGLRRSLEPGEDLADGDHVDFEQVSDERLPGLA